MNDIVVERYTIPASRRRGQVLTTIHFDDVECRFLLWRLRNVNGVIEAINHHLDPLQQKEQWTRAQVVRRVLDLIETIRHKQLVFISGDLAAAILIQAIEGNTYFWNLPADDPRRNAANITKADACRLKIQKALKRPVRRFLVSNEDHYV